MRRPSATTSSPVVQVDASEARRTTAEANSCWASEPMQYPGTAPVLLGARWVAGDGRVELVGLDVAGHRDVEPDVESRSHRGEVPVQLVHIRPFPVAERLLLRVADNRC